MKKIIEQEKLDNKLNSAIEEKRVSRMFKI